MQKRKKSSHQTRKIRGRPTYGLPHVNLRRTKKTEDNELKASQYFYFDSTPKLKQNQHHHHSQEILLHTSKINVN
jgi:hypothetical protein